MKLAFFIYFLKCVYSYKLYSRVACIISDKQKRKVTKVFFSFFLFFRFMRSALLPRSDMVCSCMSLTFGILVLRCPFGLTRLDQFFFVSYWCNIHAVRGRVKLFATEETVAKQEERRKRRRQSSELGGNLSLFFFLYLYFFFTPGALNYKVMRHTVLNPLSHTYVQEQQCCFTYIIASRDIEI